MLVGLLRLPYCWSCLMAKALLGWCHPLWAPPTDAAHRAVVRKPAVPPPQHQVAFQIPSAVLIALI